MAVEFLHIADLHLGLRITRFDESVVGKLQEARFQALENVLNEARNRPTAFALIAGDLFDDNSVDLATSERAHNLLNSFPCPVFVLPGNHDPLCAGSVWHRTPWKHLTSDNTVRVLCERTPVQATVGVTLFPCPVTAKTSHADPFEWVRPDGHVAIRIGVGHGSVMDRAQLPEDDHPIPLDTPARRGLDYVALGHWHSERRFADDRMAYPGTHEQMRFADAGFASGWQAYSSKQLDEFAGAGFGNALRVTITAPGAKPEIESLSVGKFRWREERREVMNADDFNRAFAELAQPDTPTERTLLRVKLTGVLPIEQIARLDGIKAMLSRYVWHDIEHASLSLAPSDSDVAALRGRGMSGRVLTRIESELASSADPARKAVLEHARLVLYRLSKEAEA
ncbi:MAG: DNA repair exonuclease [Planctomycetes bacterium]|nr:DNA repair exonuclease [Planctomycetota bacterium]MCW8136518.1 DNA repair exonuclease [Planctomycetota bacterium]